MRPCARRAGFASQQAKGAGQPHGRGAGVLGHASADRGQASSPSHSVRMPGHEIRRPLVGHKPDLRSYHILVISSMWKMPQTPRPQPFLKSTFPPTLNFKMRPIFRPASSAFGPCALCRRCPCGPVCSSHCALCCNLRLVVAEGAAEDSIHIRRVE